MRLGYVLSTYPGHGDFTLQCIGCECTNLVGALAYASEMRSWPPRLTTDFFRSVADTEHVARLRGASRDPEAERNFSVTTFAEFFVQINASTDCYVRAVHVPSAPTERAIRGCYRQNRTCIETAWQSAPPSRVRIDTLSWYAMTPEQVHDKPTLAFLNTSARATRGTRSFVDFATRCYS